MLDRLANLLQIRRAWLFYGLIIMIANVVLAALIVQKTTSPLWNLINMLMPIWGAFMAGSILGYLIAIPQFKDMSYSQRMLRAKVLGVLAITIVFFVFYLLNIIMGKQIGGL